MNKYSQSRVYGLSFLFPNKKQDRRYPEIVLSTSRVNSEFLQLFLHERGAHIVAAAEKYLRREADLQLRNTQQSFTFAPEKRFGVDSCAYFIEEDGEVKYHFPLIPSTDGALAFTFHLLLVALDCLPDGTTDAPANTRQLMTIHTRVDNDVPAGWGHMMGGYIYPDMRRWLARLGSQEDTDPLKQVRKAMVVASAALDPEHAKLFGDMCRARVNAKGRFILECAGNACDVAIYPDGDHNPDSDYPTQFGCHNLDWARQQLTLLAGLAVLHEMAVKELG